LPPISALLMVSWMNARHHEAEPHLGQRQSEAHEREPLIAAEQLEDAPEGLHLRLAYPEANRIRACQRRLVDAPLHASRVDARDAVQRAAKEDEVTGSTNERRRSWAEPYKIKMSSPSR